MFASDADYIFFALSVTQQLKLQSQINIAMKIVCSSHLTAGMLPRNCNKTVIKLFIANDKACQFMSTIKGIPEYYKNFLFVVFAMVKQLELPIFFMALSCIYTGMN